jgi:NTE family protein
MAKPKRARPTIGVALSGGAAHGFAHIGALKVLHEAGVPIDYLVGTSVGSVIGASYASGTSFGEMIEICGTMRWRDIARLTLSKRGLTSIERSDGLLDRLVKVKTFEQLGTRFFAVATDIRTGGIIVLSRGDLKQALWASCAIPGLFVPIEVQGRLLVDGGVAAGLPVMPLRQLGAQKIIAVDVTTRIDQGRSPENVFQVLIQSMSIVSHAAMHSARERADVLVEPRVNQYAWDDFEHCSEIVSAGEQAMQNSLEQILAWLSAPRRSMFSRLWRSMRGAGGA